VALYIVKVTGSIRLGPETALPPPDHAAHEIALFKGAGNDAENLVTGGQIGGPASH
jgi:hypothetical protein